MNTAKLEILKDTFNNEFDIEKFKKFTRELFNELDMLPEVKHKGIWREYSEHIKSYHTIAKYIDSEKNKLMVMSVELKKAGSIDRARSMQRNFVSKILDDNNLDAAIVAFYTENEPSWRLSFVRLDYSFSDKGITLDLTPSKRYSYLVGKDEPNHTAQAQLVPIFENDRKNPTLDEIENAFSIEKVTKDFFTQYKDKYLELKEYLENDDAFITETKKLGFEVGKFSEQFAKKLMGQLAFLYFLQKKGWLGVRIMPENHMLTEDEFQMIHSNQDMAHKTVLEKIFKLTKDRTRKLSPKELYTIDEHEGELLSDCFVGTSYDMDWGSGNKTFIRKIFDSCIKNTNKNFFNDYLEPLFYDALNKKRKNQYFKKFNCKIPFLNGGLFEPLEGYHWKDVNFEIPNELFSNYGDKNKEADGILDIFDRFNFTMNEDEPLEKEVAIDPEMLGKIFENLLDVSDRKSKGAFYTPREIVHYMCQESLVNYLVNEVNVPYEDIKEFILYGELIRDQDGRSEVRDNETFQYKKTIKQSIYDNIGKIDDALKNVKVADPAVGSGAFPLGMVNEIVRARNNITEYIVRKDKEGAFGNRYGEAFIKKRRSSYKLKWETIKNSIFAVDIEPSAVDIAKLRLWLSVVVEQEIDNENPEPHPLPNLDMNIHVGNSLVDEYEGIKLFDESVLFKLNDKIRENSPTNLKNLEVQINFLIDHTDEMLKEMFELQDRYFDEENEERKKEFKIKIDKIRDDLIKYKLEKDGNTDALKRYEDSLKNKTKPYFIWELEFAKVFKDKGGFDIVIGNPPYVRQEEIKEYKDIFKRLYDTFSSRADLYVYFYEKSINILNKNGCISFITSNKWMRSKYGQELRKILLEKVIFKVIIDFGGYQVFESASVDTNILIATKKEKHIDTLNKFKVCNVTENSLNDIESLYDMLSRNAFDYSIYDLDIGCFTFNDKTVINIKSKCEQNGTPLKDWKISIKCGFKTGLNEAFIIDEKTKQEICTNDPKSIEIIRKSLRGKDVKKYYCNWENFWIIVAKFGFFKEIEKYPAIKRHLTKFEDKLKNRGQCKYSRSGKIDEMKEYIGQHHWLELDNNPKMDIINMFESDEKILYPDIAQGPSFYYDTEKYYTQETCFAIIGERLKYLTGLLNSKAVTFMYRNFYAGGGLGENGIRYKKTFIERLPIPVPDKETEELISEYVDIINRIKKQNHSNYNEGKKYEEFIDEIVYKLYELTEEEIKIINN